jgi:hypothetical protein
MDKIYHRYLNLPFEIKKPPIDYTVKPECDYILLDKKDMDSDMNSWLKELGLGCYFSEVCYTPPHSKVPIHTDSYDLRKGNCNYIKINVTWGPDEGVIRFWESDKKFVVHAGIDGTLRQTAHEEDSIIVHEFNTNKPSIVNVGELHSTHNPTDEPRWTLCFIPTLNGKFISPEASLKIFDKFIVKQ